MKKSLILILGLLFIKCDSPELKNQDKASEQNNNNQLVDNSDEPNYELKVYQNGLIYSEKTINKLKHIVDSINLKYKHKEFKKKFYSSKQTIGYIVKLETENVKEAFQDMKDKMQIFEFKNKYPKAKIKKNVLVIKNKYVDLNKNEVVIMKEINLNNEDGLSVVLDNENIYNKDLQNDWIITELKIKPISNKEYITAFYFPNKFISKELPNKFAQMIEYSNFITDTTCSKFIDSQSQLEELDVVQLPENWNAFPLERQILLLEKMRSKMVWGSCKPSDYSRIQAVNIALLAAETASWQIFLKAHLDIMNENYVLMPSSFYKNKERKPYTKELEEININIKDLIFGISFRIENPSKNHYYGNISRTGLALTETKNRSMIEREILAIIADKSLDDYNRIIFYKIFVNYINNLNNIIYNNINFIKLEAAKKMLPDYTKFSSDS